ncbi:MAG TPA: endonuclease/exonuclease/phosphatase family protein [Pyrinomonadaceae bacterium]|jgi:endonuclease/exonuclease/phosphatase family metal-dependent hydrolase|nr:endonuclease/exonuclease/phosphatase family protein [Pyrinomonadaceae bacterium]
MIAKLTLAALCALMILVALRFEPRRGRTLLAARPPEGDALRVMTWNIGYADLEDDTRAHTKDLKAVAETIISHDPDAVALQELTGDAQLKILLAHLRGRYRGAAARAAGADRVEAVLVKDAAARFDEVPGGEKSALAATFRPRAGSPEVVLVSAHADAFSAARRRAYTERVVDWARARGQGRVVFVAGDFNFELRAGDESHLYTDNLKHDSESYSYILKFFRDLGRDAGDTAINDRRIDYVFAPAEGAALRRAEVLTGAVVGRMDHSPLLVEVSL